MLDLTHSSIDMWKANRGVWETTRDLDQFVMACYWGRGAKEQEEAIADAIQGDVVVIANKEEALQQAYDCLGDYLAEMQSEHPVDADGVDDVFAALDAQAKPGQYVYELTGGDVTLKIVTTKAMEPHEVALQVEKLIPELKLVEAGQAEDPS